MRALREKGLLGQVAILAACAAALLLGNLQVLCALIAAVSLGFLWSVLRRDSATNCGGTSPITGPHGSSTGLAHLEPPRERTQGRLFPARRRPLRILRLRVLELGNVPS